MYLMIAYAMFFLIAVPVIKVLREKLKTLDRELSEARA
jgi:hypothetical protein